MRHKSQVKQGLTVFWLQVPVQDNVACRRRGMVTVVQPHAQLGNDIEDDILRHTSPGNQR